MKGFRRHSLKRSFASIARDGSSGEASSAIGDMCAYFRLQHIDASSYGDIGVCKVRNGSIGSDNTNTDSSIEHYNRCVLEDSKRREMSRISCVLMCTERKRLLVEVLFGRATFSCEHAQTKTTQVLAVSDTYKAQSALQ